MLDFYNETYDTSHTLSSGYILEEIREKIREQIKSGRIMKDTALVRMTINELSKIKKIPLENAFDMFYQSDVCRLLSDRETGLFTYSPHDLARMVNEQGTDNR